MLADAFLGPLWLELFRFSKNLHSREHRGPEKLGWFDGFQPRSDSNSAKSPEPATVIDGKARPR